MMSFNSNGFLGQEIKEIMQHNYELHKELFMFCEELNRYSYCIRDKLEVRQQDYRGIILAILFINIQNSVQGSEILYRYGLNTEAKAITRTALENLFYLRAMLKDEEFQQQLLINDQINRKRILKRIKEHPDIFDNLQEIPYLKDLEDLVEETKGKRELSKEDVAKKAGLHSEYLYAYTTLCGSVHTNIRSIADECITDEENITIEAIDGGVPTTKDIDVVFYTNCHIMIIALECISEYFDLKADEQINIYRDKVLKLFMPDVSSSE
jgi:hypothetical protein